MLNGWRYRALFPKVHDMRPVQMRWHSWSTQNQLTTEILEYPRTHPDPVTGEASANFFAQVPPRRLQRAYPTARLFLLLRNPAHRAYSHYQMFQRFAAQGRRLPFALRDFSTDLRREMTALDHGGRSYFVAPGLYHQKLPGWLRQFGRKLMVIRSEDLVRTDSALDIMQQVSRFLDLEPHSFDGIIDRSFNVSQGPAMSEEDYHTLLNFYADSIERTEHLLDREMHWL